MTARRRPFYRRKRWLAVGLLWLAVPVLYALSLGPVDYAARRGLLPSWAFAVAAWVYKPLDSPAGIWDFTERTGFNDYRRWWVRLAERHAASD